MEDRYVVIARQPGEVAHLITRGEAEQTRRDVEHFKETGLIGAFTGLEIAEVYQRIYRVRRVPGAKPGSWTAVSQVPRGPVPETEPPEIHEMGRLPGDELPGENPLPDPPTEGDYDRLRKLEKALDVAEEIVSPLLESDTLLQRIKEVAEELEMSLPLTFAAMVIALATDLEHECKHKAELSTLLTQTLARLAEGQVEDAKDVPDPDPEAEAEH